MNNFVTATITFSFKGKTHSPSMQLNLDDYMQKSGQMPNLYILLAKAGNYDLYSYEYEMMQAEPIIFSNPQGIVCDFLIEGSLDVPRFEKAWADIKVFEQLKTIAKQNMSVEDLQLNPDLKNALLEAYRLGKKA